MFARALEGTRMITSHEGVGSINAQEGLGGISSGPSGDGGTAFIDTWGGLCGDSGTAF